MSLSSSSIWPVIGQTAIGLSIPHVFCMTTTFFAAVFVLINQGRLSFYSISMVKTLTHLKLYFGTYSVNTIGPRYSGILSSSSALLQSSHRNKESASTESGMEYESSWRTKEDGRRCSSAYYYTSGAPSATTASLRPFPFILRKQPSGGARQLYLGVKSL